MADNLVPQYYRVTIDNMTAASPADGFIDNVTIEEYGRLSAYPSTLELSRTKARGNFRFRRVCEELNVMQTVTNLLSIENDGGQDSEPTKFAFTIVYDRPDYVFTRNEQYPVSSVTEFFYGQDAIKRSVARIFSQNYVTKAEFPRNPVSDNQGYEWIREDLIVSAPARNITAAEVNIVVSAINFTGNIS